MCNEIWDDENNLIKVVITVDSKRCAKTVNNELATRLGAISMGY
jgi:hypothetical protein